MFLTFYGVEKSQCDRSNNRPQLDQGYILPERIFQAAWVSGPAEKTNIPAQKFCIFHHENIHFHSVQHIVSR